MFDWLILALGAAQIRTAHTDIQFPDFSAYRRAPVKGAEKDQEATADSRKTFSYLLLAGCLFCIVFSLIA